jgi:hypothetical protein
MNDIRSFFKDKEIREYSYFDITCIDNIIKEISGNQDKKINFNRLKNIYEDEYAVAPQNTTKLQTYIIKFLENEKEVIETSNGQKQSDRNKRMYIDFTYEQYGAKQKNDSDRFEFNIASPNKSIEENDQKYINFLKPRFETFINEICSSEKQVNTLFFGKKTKDLYSIRHASDKRGNPSLDEASLKKKRIFESGSIPKLLNDVVETFFNKTKLKIIRNEDEIVPDWISVDIFKKTDWESYKSTMKDKFGDIPKNETEPLYQYIIFIIQELHKEFNLYKKKRLGSSSFSKIEKFQIYYSIRDYQGSKKDYFFSENKTFSLKNTIYDYYVNHHKINIIKDQSFTINENSKDIELKIEPISSSNDSSYDRLYLKSKTLKAGVVFMAKLYNIENPTTPHHGKLYKIKKQNVSDKVTSLDSKQIFPETTRNVREFLFIPGFYFTLFHVKSFHNRQSSNLTLNKFIIDICTNKSKMEEFYLYCLNHEKSSFNKAITFPNDVQSDDKNNKKILENQTRLMLKKDIPFSLKTSSVSSGKESGKFISNSIHKISIVEDRIITPNQGSPGSIPVHITLKERDQKEKENDLKEKDKTKMIKTDCKTLKKSVMNTIKSFTQKVSNSVDLWKMDFDMTLQNKLKRGGKRTRKHRKKHKKTRRYK